MKKAEAEQKIAEFYALAGDCCMDHIHGFTVAWFPETEGNNMINMVFESGFRENRRSKAIQIDADANPDDAKRLMEIAQRALL